MTEDLGIRIVRLQTVKQGKEGLLLRRSTGVGWLASRIKTALVTDADTVGIVLLGVGTLYCLGAGEMQHTVTGNIIVVTDAVEAPCPVACLQCLHGEVSVAAGGAAVNHYQVNGSHRFKCLALSG